MEGQGSSSISNDDAPMATSNIDNGIANVDVDVDGASSTPSSKEAPAVVGPSNNIPLMSYFDTDEGVAGSNSSEVSSSGNDGKNNTTDTTDTSSIMATVTEAAVVVENDAQSNNETAVETETNAAQTVMESKTTTAAAAGETSCKSSASPQTQELEEAAENENTSMMNWEPEPEETSKSKGEANENDSNKLPTKPADEQPEDQSIDGGLPPITSTSTATKAMNWEPEEIISKADSEANENNDDQTDSKLSKPADAEDQSNDRDTIIVMPPTTTNATEGSSSSSAVIQLLETEVAKHKEEKDCTNSSSSSSNDTITKQTPATKTGVSDEDHTTKKKSGKNNKQPLIHKKPSIVDSNKQPPKAKKKTSPPSTITTNNPAAAKANASSPNSQVIEAERQAAIAAAISANSSTMSPSVAAGIAKVLALPGLMSDKVGEMSDRAAEVIAAGSSNVVLGKNGMMPSSSSTPPPRGYPPPPPPRTTTNNTINMNNSSSSVGNNNHAQYHHRGGPTMVALPPISPPKGRGMGQIMRPVRFDDVKIAFGEILLKKEEAEKEKKKMMEANKNEDREEDKTTSIMEEEDESKKEEAGGQQLLGASTEEGGIATDADKKKKTDEGEQEELSTSMDVDNEVKQEESADKSNEVDEGKGEGKEATDDVEGGNSIDVESEKSAATTAQNEGGTSSLENPAAASDPEQKKGEDESSGKEGTSCDNVEDEATEENEKKRKDEELPTLPQPLPIQLPIPDSYLRFLLLIARVPIIIEEHKPSKKGGNKEKKSSGKAPKAQKNDSGSPPATTPNNAAKSAAKRVHEIYCMVQSNYEQISERQQRNLTEGGRADATSSFFAACAGEHVDEPMDLDDDDINCKQVIDTAVVSPPSVKPLISGMNGQGKGGGATDSASVASNATASTSASSTIASSFMGTSASVVFSNVMSKMVTKKQSSFSEIGKKFMGGGGNSAAADAQLQQRRSSAPMQVGQLTSNAEQLSIQQPLQFMEDYEIMIDQEMLGLTVENVLERTIIRTLLPDGAAKHAGAQVGSLIAKVGNVDTSNLTHFETIDELRQSQRPLKLTLRHIGQDILRKAREEMGRLIRGTGLASSSSLGNDADGKQLSNKPWRENNTANRSSSMGETFDSVLSHRWPLKSNKSSLTSGMAASSASQLAMTRGESIHQAGKDLIRILALLVVGLENELSELKDSMTDSSTPASTDGGSSVGTNHRESKHLSKKELSEAIEITSKILLDYARGHPDVDEKSPRAGASGNKAQYQSASSSFYPVPPGRVQGKKHGAPGGRGGAGRGGRGGRGKKGSQTTTTSPLLRIGDALSRTRSFLVELSSTTATNLRWEIIDYLCSVLDLDTEQELSEKESASSSSGADDNGSPTNDLGSAGNILKLIILNCSTMEDDDSDDSSSTSSIEDDEDITMDHGDGDSEDQQSFSKHEKKHNAGNCFLSVVHRLAASKSTSARVSAGSLGPLLWSHLDFPRQLQLRGVITRALHDVEVIVRKSTATVLHAIAELAFDRRAVPWLVLMCERSMTDPEPQLRAAAMTLTWHLAEHLPNAFSGDARKGSRSIRRLPPRNSPTFMDVYLLQCKLLPVANNLAEDRVASVRLSVAAQCDRLCDAMGDHWFSVIIDLLQALLSDADERVRSEAILCMPRLVESVIVGSTSSSTTVLESLLPLALKIQKDPSSSVRSSLATATGELLIFLVGLGGAGSNNDLVPPPSPGRKVTEDAFKQHKKHVDDTLIPILQKLLQDSDPEVTTASLRAVTNASRSGARETASTSIPTCSHVKIDSPPGSAVDDDLVSLSSLHSHQSHTSYERTKPVFIPVLSEEQVLRLLPTLSNLATSTQWRVRQSAVEIVPALMGCTHRHETRHEISKLCLRLMNDKVDAVRKAAAECLCLGGSSLARHGEEDGGTWITNIVIPALGTCSQSDDSKQRQLCLKMVEVIITNGLCPTASKIRPATPSSPPTTPRIDDDESTASSGTTGPESALRMILNVAATLTSDPVANVRLNVGRTFGAIMMLLGKSDVEFVVTILERQLDEETARSGGADRDVVYFAQQAISMAEPTMRRQLSLCSA